MVSLNAAPSGSVANVVEAAEAFLSGPRQSEEAVRVLLARASLRNQVEALGSSQLQQSQVVTLVACLRHVLVHRTDFREAVDLSVLKDGLVSESEDVRVLCIEIAGLFDASALRHAGILQSVVRALDDADIKVAAEADRTLQTLGIDQIVAMEPETESILRGFADGSGAQKEVTTLRLLELFAKTRPASTFAKEALTEKLKSGTETSDVLLRLNFYEIVVPVASQRQGMQVLAEAGVFGAMGRELANAAGDEIDLDAMLTSGGILRVLCRIALLSQAESDVELLDPVVGPISTLLKNTSSDASLREGAIAFTGNLGESPAGWAYLRSSGLLSEFIKLFQGRPEVSLRPVALNTLALLIAGASTSEDGRELMGNAPGQGVRETMRQLMRFAQEPFDEVKMGALKVFEHLAGKVPWGLHILADTPGWVDLVCSAADADKQIRAKKSDVVTTVMRAGPLVSEIFGHGRYTRLVNVANVSASEAGGRPEPQVDIATMQH